MRIIFAYLLLSTSIVFAQVNTPPIITKVITLNYIQAEAVAQELKPLLLPGELLEGKGSSLIVSVSPDTLTRLRTIIQKLDVPPVVFAISIHQGSDDWLNNQGQNDAVYSVSSRTESGNAQSVRVMSGHSAFISTGNTRPVISSVSGGIFPGVSYEQQHETQGFYVEPVLQGQQVKITISRVRQQADQINNQNSQDQNLETTTMVPLNQWAKLGSAGQSDVSDQPSSTTYSAGNSFVNEAVLYIKIMVVR